MSPDLNRSLSATGGRRAPVSSQILSERSNEVLGAAAAAASSDRAQREAFDELFRRLWRTSVEWARAGGAGPQHLSEDAATQAWFKAWKYRHKFDSAKGCYGTWLGTIVRNETFDLLKLQTKEVATDLSADCDSHEIVAVGDPDPDGLDYVFEALEALARVKPEFARVLSLKAQGYRDRQICKMLDIPTPGTVGSRLSRSKQFIATWLAERNVVFLAEGAPSNVHPMGLAPLCRTGDGIFYGFSPLAGLFVLPKGTPPPPRSTAVCEGFFVKIWSYPLDRFEVRVRAQSSNEGAIFSWNQYTVLAKGDSAPVA